MPSTIGFSWSVGEHEPFLFHLVAVGAQGKCGKRPIPAAAFSKRLWESRSLRSDFQGIVGELWEGGPGLSGQLSKRSVRSST